MSVFEQLQQIIADQTGIEIAEITEDKDIIKDLGCDSLDIVEMLMTVEEKYGFEVDDSDVEGLSTIGDVVKYIEQKA